MKINMWLLVLGTALVAASCGSSDPGDADAATESASLPTEASEATNPDTTEASEATNPDSGGNAVANTEPPPATAAPTTTEPALDMPTGLTEASAICSTGIGFSDLPAYDPSAAGPHPVLLFVENLSGTPVEPNLEIPDDWTITNDRWPELELIACGALVERAPSGGTCEYTFSDGSPLSLDLLDVIYEVDVLAAATGESTGSFRFAASSIECPELLSNYTEGQTEYFNPFRLDTDEAAVVAELEAFVLP